jgi:hypothetical protein
MNTTELISPPEESECPTFGDELAELLPFVAAVFVLGPITLLCLVLWAPFLLLFAPVVAVAGLVSIIALAGTVVATPFVLLHHRRRSAVERKRSAQRTIAIRGAVAQVGGPQ